MRKNDLAAVKRCILFSSAKEKTICSLFDKEKFTIMSYKKNEDIFTPESYSKSLAVILSGVASVYKKHTLMSILSPGAIFGMSALFYETEDFPTTVKAREDCRVLFITKEQLNEIFRTDPITIENYITILSERIHYLNTKIDNLTAQSPTEKLLVYLEALSEKTTGEEFSLPISLSELANSLSIGRTSLYRAFEELEANRQLVKNGKKIRLINTRKEEII